MRVWGGLLLACLFVWDAVPGHAQRSRGTATVGLQVGQPGGLTGKLYRSPRTAYQGLLTTDGNDFVSLRLHWLRERALPDSLLHLYVGPGLLVGLKQIGDGPTPQLGGGVQVGLNFYAERFEVFLHLTPGLHALPDPRAALGAGVGLRYTLPRR
jgi:hypothetical protein